MSSTALETARSQIFRKMEEVIPLNIVSSACPEIVDSVPDRWREKSHFLEGVKFWRCWSNRSPPTSSFNNNKVFRLLLISSINNLIDVDSVL